MHILILTFHLLLVNNVLSQPLNSTTFPSTTESAVDDDIAVRLVDGDDTLSGRLEIRYQCVWGTVCSDEWDQMDAEVVCKMLQAPGVRSIMTSYGPGSGPIWLDNVQCNGSESTIGDCSHRGWGVHDCSHEYDVGLACQDVRLVDGRSILEGRVEIHNDNSWGTICDNRWGRPDADVVCKQIGFQSAFKATGAAAFGKGLGPILLDDVQCRGDEEQLRQCYNRGWEQHVCQHSQDAGVICDEVRLIGGSGEFEGRIEILNDGVWGTVCNDAWDVSDARIVCQQLGYEDVLEYDAGVSRFGEGTGQIWLDEVACDGSEKRLVECGRAMWGDTDCNHSEDVGIVCVTGSTLRLERGSQASGRVEVLYDGIWGTVCDDQWDIADAVVVCQYLGFPGASWFTTGGNYGEGSGPVWMSQVQCTGAEARLQDCTQLQEWGDNECDHSRDSGVVCVSKIPDIEPPVISDCPADITVLQSDRSSSEITVAWRQPIASDNSNEIPSVDISHTPGSTFSIGATTVTYTFTDLAGNEAVCEFDVIVEELPPTTTPPTTMRPTTTVSPTTESTYYTTDTLTTGGNGSTTVSVTNGSSTGNEIRFDLIIYLVIPLSLAVCLVLLVAACVLCVHKNREREKSKPRPESQVYLASSPEAPTTPPTLAFEMTEPSPPVASRSSGVMEGRSLPPEPDLHEYTDADSGHYEALPALRDEDGYLILYDEAKYKESDDYMVPDYRLSATQEDLYNFDDQRSRSPVTFTETGYESTLHRTPKRKVRINHSTTTEPGRSTF